ncbi:MAG: sialidase family protein, partial [Candidatus Thermoplasmatota archaeon]|nr:sialidase family protein [Candidatus Thermoplasmatota archaeon]
MKIENKMNLGFSVIVSILLFIPLHSFAYSEGFVNCEIKDTTNDWSQDIILSSNLSARSFSPAIAVNNDTVHLIWVDWEDIGTGGEKMYYRQSLDNGRSWGNITKVATDVDGYSLGICVNNNIIHTISSHWFEVYYKRSLDNGDNWGPDVLLSEDDGVFSWHPSVAVSGNTVHVVWDDEKDYGIFKAEIYYKRGLDNGSVWDDGQGNNAPRRLTFNEADSSKPLIAVNGSTIHVVWSDRRLNNVYETFYKRSDDNGRTWTDDINITVSDNFHSGAMDIEVNEEKVYVVGRDARWTSDGFTDYKIWFAKSEDKGKTWSHLIYLVDHSTDGYYCDLPSITVGDSGLFVTFSDNRSGKPCIYLKYSADGAKWDDELLLVEMGGAGIIRSQNSSLHLVFQRGINGTPEVFYKRSPDFASNIALTTAPNILTADGLSTSIITATVT